MHCLRPSFVLSLLFASSFSVAGAAPCAGWVSFAEDDAPDAALSRAQLEELGRGSLFRLHVRDPRVAAERTSGEALCLRIQPGFLIGEEGLALTRAAALQGVKVRGNALRVEFQDRPGEHTVELLHVDPALDLALLRIREVAPRAKVTEAGQAEEREGEDRVGEDLAIEGRTPALRGIPFDAPEEDADIEPAFAFVLGDLASPAAFRVSLVTAGGPPASGASSGLRGVQGRCVGGAPLVDAAGNLVGITRWSWPGDGEDARDPISAHELAAFLAAERSASARPVSTPGGFPLIRWERDPGKADDLRGILGTQTRKLVSDLYCPRCSGRGWKPAVIRRYGKYKIKNELKPVDCRDCKGRGLKAPDRLWTVFRQLSAAVVPHAQVVGSSGGLADTLKSALSINPEGIIEALEIAGRRALLPSEPIPGAAVALALVGMDLEHAGAIDGSGLRAYRIPEGRLPGLLLLDVQPQSIEENQILFLFGVVAGAVIGPDGDALTVVDGCVVVPITL